MDPPKSKNQKKREKKREANLKEKIANSKQAATYTTETHEDPVQVIRAQLAEAKAAGDTKLVSQLRQDLWILQDVNAGIDPVCADKKDIEESLERLANHIPTKVLMKNNVTLEDKSNPPPVEEKTSEPAHEKEIRKLNKKLRDIENLKEKQRNGTVLESTQLDKIAKEEGIQEEIRQLEQLMSTMMRKR